MASRAELTCASYTVSNEERSTEARGLMDHRRLLSGSALAPRYVWDACMWPCDTHAETEALLFGADTSGHTRVQAAIAFPLPFCTARLAAAYVPSSVKTPLHRLGIPPALTRLAVS